MYSAVSQHSSNIRMRLYCDWNSPWSEILTVAFCTRAFPRLEKKINNWLKGFASYSNLRLEVFSVECLNHAVKVELLLWEPCRLERCVWLVRSMVYPLDISSINMQCGGMFALQCTRFSILYLNKFTFIVTWACSAIFLVSTRVLRVSEIGTTLHIVWITFCSRIMFAHWSKDATKFVEFSKFCCFMTFNKAISAFSACSDEGWKVACEQHTVYNFGSIYS